MAAAPLLALPFLDPVLDLALAAFDAALVEVPAALAAAGLAVLDFAAGRFAAAGLAAVDLAAVDLAAAGLAAAGLAAADFAGVRLAGDLFVLDPALRACGIFTPWIGLVRV